MAQFDHGYIHFRPGFHVVKLRLKFEPKSVRLSEHERHHCHCGGCSASTFSISFSSHELSVAADVKESCKVEWTAER